jgi:hypothetical protein
MTRRASKLISEAVVPQTGYTGRTLQAQLAPLAAKMRTGRALIEPVSQVTLRLGPVDRKDRFADSVAAVLKWMSPRAGRKLPDEAWAIKSFELADVGAQRVTAVSLNEPRFWSARIDDADKKIPLRTWVTEIGVGAIETGEVLFGARLICAARGENPTYDRSVPGFVRQVMATGPFSVDGETQGWDSPLVVSTEAQVDDLVTLLERPGRRLPVIVFALPDRSEEPSQTVVDAAQFLKNTCIAAHVRILTARASFELTDRVGKEMSVYWQAVRMYRPGFSRWRDSPMRHPLFLPERVERWEGGRDEFSRWLVDQVLTSSIAASDREEEVPSFGAVRQIAAQLERKKLVDEGGSQAELLKLFEEDNQRLSTELRDERERTTSQLASLERERDLAQQQVDDMRREAFDLRSRIDALLGRLKAAGQAVPQTPIPESLKEFETWCREHLAGSVTLHNRAFRGVQKSKFADPKLIYQALLLLRDHYVAMRVEGGAERRVAFEQACKALKLEDSLVGDATRTHRDLYTVDYRGRPRTLDRHLKRGVAHDDTRSFRLYYFWDDEAETVVVGWLPSHLDNAMT